MQHKYLQIEEVDLKFSDDKNVKIKGYASKFDGVDSYGDTIAKGAYTNTLQDRERPIALKWNHYGPVIGKWTKIEQDEKGLYVEGELSKGHSVADDAAALLKHGAISGLSIGYMIKDAEDNKPHKGRLLKDIELFEISVVEEPADNLARIDSIKSLSEAKTLKEIEAAIRDAFGLSRSEGTAIVSSVKNCIKQSDSEAETSENLDEIALKLHNFLG